MIAWFGQLITSIEKEWTEQCIVKQKIEIGFN